MSEEDLPKQADDEVAEPDEADDPGEELEIEADEDTDPQDVDDQESLSGTQEKSNG